MPNHIPDFIHDTNEILYDIIVWDEDDIDTNTLKKIKYRLGTLIMLSNYLERQIDEMIVNEFSDDLEDTRIWLAIKDYTFDKKIKYLESIIIEKVRNIHRQELIGNVQFFCKKLDNVRIDRNLYIHANWLNTYNKKYVEIKIKDYKDGVFRQRKEIKISDIDKTISDIEGLIDSFDDFQESFSYSSLYNR